MSDLEKNQESIVNTKAFTALLDGITATFTEAELLKFEQTFKPFDEYMAERAELARRKTATIAPDQRDNT